MTFKILYNDAVAMTGGQPVDGIITVDGIARQVEAEGVKQGKPSYFLNGEEWVTTWFDNVYVKRWGEANDTEVIVDHINQADIPARAAAVARCRSNRTSRSVPPGVARRDVRGCKRSPASVAGDDVLNAHRCHHHGRR